MQCQKTHQQELLQQEELVKTHLEEIFAQNKDQELITAMDILHKLITNVLNSPHEEKFRVIKKTNAALQKKLFILKGPLHQLITDMGYVDMDEEHYAFVGEHFQILLYAQNLIDQRTMKVKVKYMTPEERKHYDLLEEQKRLVREELEKKRQAKELLKKQLEADRREKAQETVVASHANELSFGANVVKFKPPEPQQRRG